VSVNGADVDARDTFIPVPLPPNVQTGRVIGTFTQAIAGPAGAAPVLAPCAGTVTFTATPAFMIDAGSAPPLTILPQPFVASLDANGAIDITLMATDDLDLNPSGWTYTVSFAIGPAYGPFSVRLPAGSVVDLSLVAPVASSNGQAIIVGPKGDKGDKGDPGPQGATGTPGSPPSEMRPQDQGAVAWTCNPARYVQYCQYATATYAGRLLLFSFMSGAGGVVNRISYAVGTVATGISNAFLGIYDAGGNLLGNTADQSANMVAISNVNAALLAPVTLAPGAFYRVGMVIGAATAFPACTGFPLNSPNFTNLGLAAGKYMTCWATGLSGLTALPAQHGNLGPVAGGLVMVLS
jgi:hypothetical protein